jgi:hypothetical protein
MLMNFSIIAGTIIAGYIEYDSRSKRNSEFFNETTIMCVLYCMICFSPFVPDIKVRQAVGYFCCLIVSLHLAINLLLISFSTMQQLKLKV